MDKIVGMFAKLLPLLAYYPRWVQTVFTIGVGGMLVTIFFLIVLYPSAARTKDGDVDDVALPTLIKAGRSAHLDYIIESATMIVDMDADGAVPGQTSVVDVHINYLVFALNPVTIFDEDYHSMSSNTISLDRLHGADPETDFLEPSPTRKTWNVKLNLMPGVRQSILTGARYVYKLPFPEKRTIHDFIDLKPTEDVWGYPNKEDVIGEFTIIIQSRTPIRPPNDGDMLLVDRSDPTKLVSRPDKPLLEVPDQGSRGSYVLSARWHNLRPGQTMELRLARDVSEGGN
jgi:hypothetical protein